MIRKFLFLFSFCIYAPWASGQYMFRLNDKDITCLNYIGGDEFNTNRLDTSAWIDRLPYSRVTVRERSFYASENVIVGNGVLTLITKPEKRKYVLESYLYDTVLFTKNKNFPNQYGEITTDYTAGMIWSRKPYAHGYFECKIKLEFKRGMWPAFWLYGKEGNEIDFVEYKGERNKQMHIDVHCPTGCRNYIQGALGYRKRFGHWVDVNGSIADQYHLVSGWWNKDGVRFYLNGNLLGIYRGSILAPQDIIVGLGLASDDGPFNPGPDASTIFPCKLEVDYIRAWSVDSVLPSTAFEKLDFSSLPRVNYNLVPKGKIKFKRKVKGEIYEDVFISILPLGIGKWIVNTNGLTKGDSVILQFISGNKVIKQLQLSANGDNIIELASKEGVEVKVIYKGNNYVKKF
ncbi:MAG: glycoside hydrolase family 16 protein [Bacteroidetes bacterium]|nr:glycoside hydrolase family 16 protein [Bacteroidota bacterium]